MRQKVCGRLFWTLFAIAISLASSSTCKCRLRFPSVSAQSCLRSPNNNPFECVTSDVNTLSGGVPGLTTFTVVLTNNTTPPSPVPAPSGGTPGPAATPAPHAATLTINVTSPVNLTASDCPGGNGNASKTIVGHVEQ